jgi:hypothetical protein
MIAVSFQELHRYQPTPEDREFEEQVGRVLGRSVDKQFYTKAVGVTFPNSDGSNRQTFISGLTKFDLLDLVREPSNPADGHAVRVESRTGVTLGYLDRYVAAEIAEDFDKRGRIWLAIVRRVIPREGDHNASLIMLLCRLTEEYVAEHPAK